jgi:hypothetical protein
MSSARWRRCCLGGIIRVVLELKTRWTSNIRSQSPKALTPDTGEGKCEGPNEHAREKYV